MPTFRELLAGFSKSPLPTMLALSALLIFGLWGRIWAQSEAKELALREATATEKRCAEQRLAEQRRNEIEKDSIYWESLRATNAALEKMGEMRKEIKRLQRR